MTDAQFREMLEFIRRTRKEGRIGTSYACEGFLGDYETEVRDYFYQCAAGVSVASIRVDGAISGCTSIRANFHQGNIYRDKFWDVWQNRFEPFRNRDWARRGACTSAATTANCCTATITDCSYAVSELSLICCCESLHALCPTSVVKGAQSLLLVPVFAD